MGRVLLVVWDGGGNVPPAIALGVRLAASGHAVEGFGSASLTDRFARDGLAFTAFDGPDFWDTTALAIAVRDHAEQTRPDVAVVDYMLPGALCGAEVSGESTIAFVHTLYAGLLDGGDHPSPMGMAASPDSVNAARAALGLRSVASFGALLDRATRVMVTSPQELDAPLDATPGNVVYAGPVFEPADDDAGWSPPPGDAPLVVVSMGTTPMDEGPVVQKVLDGLADAPVRVLAMCGAHLDAGSVQMPPNATRSGYVRHAAVLPHADVVVDHAGLGTVLTSLAHGLPQVCVPLGRDQPANAEAVRRVGAGRVVDPTATSETLRDAVLAALESGPVRAAAERLAAAIGGPTAGDRATEIVSRLVTG